MVGLMFEGVESVGGCVDVHGVEKQRGVGIVLIGGVGKAEEEEVLCIGDAILVEGDLTCVQQSWAIVKMTECVSVRGVA